MFKPNTELSESNTIRERTNSFAALCNVHGGSHFSTGVIFLRVRHVKNRHM